MSKDMNHNIETDNDAPLTGDELIPIEFDMLQALRIRDNPEQVAAQPILVCDPMLNRDGKPKKHESEPSFPICRFKVRPLSEKEIDQCKERNTRYIKNKRLGGIKLVDNVDTVRYRSELIYIATVPEADGKKIWDNPLLREMYPSVLDKIEIIDKVIKWAGVKDSIVDKINEISGFDADTTEESVKN